MSKPGELLLALIDRPGNYATLVDPKLIVGDHVKVGFKTNTGTPYEGEWMWLEVTEVTGDWSKGEASYKGELCNRPRFIDPAVLRAGSPVVFGPGHIYAVIHDSPQRPEGEREQPRPGP
jgi:hypothetical protein